jgi:tetratricopeptide (TPR) repeat protein
MAAWELRPGERQLLLDLARAWQDAGRIEDSRAALIAAARGSQPWVAEQARELEPQRCPYAVEFRRALDLDPANFAMRREFIFLLLEVKQTDEAERELRILTDMAPQDMLAATQLGFLLLAREDRAGAMIYLDRVLKSGDPDLVARVKAALKVAPELKQRSAVAEPFSAKEMGQRSYAKAYMQDAVRYLEIAHETDPPDRVGGQPRLSQPAAGLRPLAIHGLGVAVLLLALGRPIFLRADQGRVPAGKAPLPAVPFRALPGRRARRRTGGDARCAADLLSFRKVVRDRRGSGDALLASRDGVGRSRGGDPL